MNRLFTIGWIASITSSLAMALAMALAGCGGKESAQPLTPQQFFSPAVEETPMSSVDQPGPIEYNQVSVDLLQTPAEQKAQQEQQQRRATALAPVPPATAPAPSPATLPAGFAPGGYMTIGGVLVEVNGQPIYADQVLRDLERELASKARAMDEEQFRKVAQQEIADQIQWAVRNELVFAAADRSLDQREHDFAENLTANWRQEQITAAGGSLEVARHKAREQGRELEDLVKEKYRDFVVRLYQQRSIYPRIQVTADDMRRYYQRNLDKEFTEHGQARFRLIKVEIKKIGSRADAQKRAQETRDRVVNGNEDFAEVAASPANHDETLRKAGGDVGFVDRGSFRLEKVEDAVWQLQPGQVSDIIETDDAFYLAQLIERKDERVRQFEDPAVQNRIRDKLWSQQFQELSEADYKRLRDEAMVQTNDQMLQVALEMAMQKYPAWSAGKPKANEGM